MIDSDHDRWLTVKEAGEYLSYSPCSIRRFAKSGKLKSVRAPGTKRGLRFRVSWLDEFLLPPKVESKPIVSRRRRKKAIRKSKSGVDRFQVELEKARGRLAKQGA